MSSRESSLGWIFGHRAYVRLLVGLLVALLIIGPQMYYFRHYGHRYHDYSAYDAINHHFQSSWEEGNYHRWSSGPLNPYAEKVYMMLKTGHKVLRTRLPVHFDTQLTRWPHFGVYADVNETVNGVETVDVFAMLPQHMQETTQDLEDYRILQQARREHWGWDYDQFSSDHGWDSDRFKNIPMLAHAWQTAPQGTEWYVFIDDDTFVFQYGLISMLQRYNANKKIYIGSPALLAWGDETVTFAHGGSGVVLSKGAMEVIFGKDRTNTTKITEVVNHYSESAQHTCCGDAMVAVALNDGGVKLTTPWGYAPEMKEGFQGADIAGIRVEDGGWCVPLYSWHHATNQEIESLFWIEEEHARHKELYFSDIYRIFMLPYITEEREAWDSYARDWQFNPEFFENTEHEKYGIFADLVASSNVEEELGHKLRPHESKDMCKKACSIIAECLEWTWRQDDCRLELWRVVRGKAHSKYLKGVDKDDHTVSGWMLDRIRERRLEAQCDSLEYDEVTKQWNDDETTSEGWFVRQLERNATST